MIALRMVYGALDLTDYPFALEFGADFGAPQNQSEALAFLLQDGEIELSDRASNRTFQFNVLLEGSDLLQLAENEAALVAETEKPRNTLTIDPGDGFGVPTVYDVFRGQVALVRDDSMEQANLRRYSVTVKALPFGRSATETVTPALPTSGTTTTLVNNGSATTNWTGAVDGVSTAPSVVSGAVGITTGSVLGPVVIALTYTAAIATSSTKYLVVDWKPESPGQSATLRAYADSVELVQLARAASPAAGYTRSWFGPIVAASVAVLRLDGYSETATHGYGIRSLFIDNVSRTDVKPTLGSARQLLRNIAFGGSAPAQGALAVEHASSALGDVLVYTYPDVDETGRPTGEYVPALRSYRVAGGATTTTDTAMVSGARDNILAATSTFDVPLSRLVRGGHIFVIRAGYAAAGGPQTVTFNWTMQVWVGGIANGPIEAGTQAASLVATAGNIVVIGKRTLPPLDVDPASPSAVLRVTITATAPGAVTAVPLDEAWLFNTELGDLLGPVVCGTGTPAAGSAANRLFIEAASVTVPRSTVRMGFAADRSDSFYPRTVGGWQLLRIKPPRVNVFTVTTNALDAAVTFRGYNRWHTHAAS